MGKKIQIYVLMIIFFAIFYNSSEYAAALSFQNKISKKITHYEQTPSIIRRSNPPDKSSPTELKIDTQLKKTSGDIKLQCYCNGLCFVKDVRSIKVNNGINSIELEGLFDGIIPETLNFRALGNSEIKILNYKFSNKELSRESLLESSIGNDVFYSLFDSSDLKKGKLLDLSKESDNTTCAIIDGDQKRFVLPISKCLAIDKNSQKNNEKNRVQLTFDSAVSGEIRLEINYITTNIKWSHFCSADVFEKLDRIDIQSQAVLKNDTDSDLGIVDVVFDTATPLLLASQKDCGILSFDNFLKETNIYESTLDVKKKSSITSVIMSKKELKPILEYIVRVPVEILEKTIVGGTTISCRNLLIIEDAKKIGLDVNFQNSDIFLFQRKNNERNFLGRNRLSSFKNGDDLGFEIGNTSDIIAVAHQTDFRKLSEKQFECGVRVSIENKKDIESVVSVVLGVSSFYTIVKSNFETEKSRNPTWKLRLKPKEVKELHFRIRMNKPMKLLVYPNPALCKKCQDVAIGDPDVCDILDEMIKKMCEWDGCGLAAPQVGIHKKLTVLSNFKNPESYYKMINPKIIWKSKNLIESNEGCLSLPGIREKIMRYDSVIVEYFDESFTKQTIEADGILAICLQHEIDHLNGKLFIDRLSDKMRNLCVERYKKNLEEQSTI